MRHHHYIVNGTVLRVTSAQRPNANHRRPFIVREYDGETWVMPVFPEITAHRLLSGEYLGNTPVVPASTRVEEEA